MFYVVPLFLSRCSSGSTAARLGPRGRRAAAIAAARSRACSRTERLITTNAVSDTLTLLPIWSLQTALFPIEQIALVVVLACIAAAVLLGARAAPLRARPPALSSSTSRSRRSRSRGSTSTRRSARSSPGSRCRATGSTRTLGRDSARDDDLVGARATSTRSGRTRSSTAACGASTSCTAARGRPARDEGDGRPARPGVMTRRQAGALALALADSSVELGGRPVAQDPRTGMTCTETTGRCGRSRSSPASTRGHVVGQHASYTRLGCKGGTLTVGLQSDPALFTKPQTVVARIGGQRWPTAADPGRCAARLRRPAAVASNTVCNVDFEVSPTAVPAIVTNGFDPDRASSALHFTVHLHGRECASPSTSRRCPTRGRASATTCSARCAGSSRRAARRVVAFAPTSAPGRRTIREALAGLPVEPRLRFAPVRALLAAGLEPRSGGRRSSASSALSTCCTSPTGCTRRSAAASARRWSTTSCRSGFPSGRRGGRGGCTARSTGTPRAPATSSSSTPSSRRARCVELLGVPPEKVVVAHPGVGERLRARRRARRPRAAVRAHGRDARAAQEPRDAARRAAAARPRARGRRRGGVGQRSRGSTGPT